MSIAFVGAATHYDLSPKMWLVGGKGTSAESLHNYIWRRGETAAGVGVYRNKMKGLKGAYKKCDWNDCQISILCILKGPCLIRDVGWELWQIKGILDKDLWKLILVNRPIKVAFGWSVKEKLERVPTSSKTGASAGVAFSTGHGAGGDLDIYLCITSTDPSWWSAVTHAE